MGEQSRTTPPQRLLTMLGLLACSCLAAAQPGTIVNFGDASTIGTVQDHAWALESVLRNLQQVQQVQFVAHSMGNLLVGI